MQEIVLKTSRRIEFVDITGKVAEVVRTAQKPGGICTVFCPHTTAGITLNEHADPAVAQDIARQLSTLIPSDNSYSNSEGNADAHIKAALIGHSIQIIVENGVLMLGTWQGVFFCEFDGPRTRRIWVTVS